MATGQDKRLDQEQRLGAQINENKQSLKELLALRKQNEAEGKKDAALTAKISKLQKQINSDTIKYRNIKKQIAEFTKKEMEFSEIITDYSGEMSKTLQKQLPSIKAQAEAQGGIANRTKEAVSHAKLALKHVGPLGDMYGQSALNLKEMNETELELLQNQQNVGTSLYDNTNLEQSLENSKKNLLSLENMYANNKDKMHHKSRKAIEDTIERQKAQINYQEKLNTANEIQNEQLNAASEYIGGIFESFRSSLQSMPGGSLLASFVLPEAVLKNFKEKTSEIFNGMAKGAIDTKQGFEMLKTEGVDVLKTAFGALGKTFGGIKIVQTLLAAVGLMKILSKSAQYIQERTDTIGENLGAVGIIAYGRQIRNATNAVMDLGYETSDVLSMQSKLTDEYGIGRETAINMTEQMAQISKTIGLQVDEGAELVGMFNKFQGINLRNSEEFIKQGAYLALMENVAPEAVMKDIAGSADLVATYTKGGAENVFRMAIEAKKLGMEMSDIDTIAKGLLDVDTSLSAEMEFMALTGKQVNLQRARILALDEDWAGLNQELTRQFGDQAFWANSTRIEKELMGDILGTDVKTMGKLINADRERLSLGKAIQGTMSMDDMLGQNALSQISRLSNSLKKISATMWEVFGPAIEFIAGVFSGFLKFVTDMPGAMFAMRAALVTLTIAMGVLTAKGIIQLFVLAGTMAAKAASFTGPAAPITFGVILTGLVGTIYGMLSEAQAAGASYAAMADGGVVKATAGGTPSVIGEAGKPEAVIPLGTSAADKYLGGDNKKELNEMKVQNNIVIQVLKQIYGQFETAFAGGKLAKDIGSATVNNLTNRNL